MKRILLAITALLTMVGSALAADGITVGNVTVEKGGSATLSFELVNTDHDYTGVEFLIELVDGLSFELNNKGKIKVTKGDRLDGEDFTLSVADQGNNKYKVLGYYTDGSSIPEKSGELFSLKLLASADAAKGSKACKLSDILFSTPDEQGITPADVNFTINVTGLSITAKDYSRQYGEANPTFDYTVEGGTVTGTPLLTCEATAKSPVGTYPIVVSQGSVTNSGVAFTNGTLTVTKAPLTIKAKSCTITRGDALPQFELSYEGFKNGETNSVLTSQPVVSCAATAMSQPGVYDITVSGAGAQNYEISYVAGTLTINKRYYSVTVNSTDPEKGTVSTSLSSTTVEEGTQITLTATPKTGYHFVKWSDGTTTNPYKFTATANVSLSAEFAPNQYKMTFVLDNGEADVEKTQDYGTELTAPADLQRTGYTFKGWSPEVPATVPAEDKTFTAQWQINQYTMTFVLGNGEADIVKTQDYQTALEKPADPQREGYTFKGWDKEIPATIPAEDMTFTAQWQVNKYKVTFIVDGQTVKEEEVEYGAPIEKPADPQKDTYTFIGWTPEVPATMPATDMTFTAQFALNPYTMTFVLGNGEADIVKTQECGSALTPPADPTREGYTFMGWSPEVPANIPDHDMTFTAQWQINQYKMIFKLENGEADVEKTQDYGTELTAPANLVKTGYTFTGWTPEVPATVPAEDMTFTAQWQVNQYTVTFVLGNGEADIVKTQDYDSALEAPADPTREGYTFTGWDTEIPATVPAEDKTFTAQWQVNKYKVTFIVDGQTVKEEEVEYGAPIEKPADPQKDTYTFIGWTPEVPATMPASDMTFTAQFAQNPYTMTFVLGNGEADIVKTQECGSALTPPADPTREGYTFTGWSPEVPATVPGEDMTFTAQWKVNQYAIIYMLNGQEWARDMVDYGTAITLREYTPVADETFSGWTFEDGETYTTMPAHDVIVVGAIVTSIQDVLKGQTTVDVYDLRGRLMRRNIPVKDLRKVLRTGVYIINGRKIVLK